MGIHQVPVLDQLGVPPLPPFVQRGAQEARLDCDGDAMRRSEPSDLVDGPSRQQEGRAWRGVEAKRPTTGQDLVPAGPTQDDLKETLDMLMSGVTDGGTECSSRASPVHAADALDSVGTVSTKRSTRPSRMTASTGRTCRRPGGDSRKVLGTDSRAPEN